MNNIAGALPAYCPLWEPLGTTLARVTLIGIPEDEAKRQIAAAVANRTIAIRIEITPPNKASKVRRLEDEHVKPPTRLGASIGHDLHPHRNGRLQPNGLSVTRIILPNGLSNPSALSKFQPMMSLASGVILTSVRRARLPSTLCLRPICRTGSLRCRL
jgi:hypothetical protein